MGRGTWDIELPDSSQDVVTARHVRPWRYNTAPMDHPPPLDHLPLSDALDAESLAEPELQAEPSRHCKSRPANC